VAGNEQDVQVVTFPGRRVAILAGQMTHLIRSLRLYRGRPTDAIRRTTYKILLVRLDAHDRFDDGSTKAG